VTEAIVVSRRGAARFAAGHPWVYRSDIHDADRPAGIVRVVDERGRHLGRALWSPRSEIRLRRLTAGDEPVDRAWWARRIERAWRLRESLDIDATACRIVHAEGDGLPSLVIDRYGDFVVAQFLSAGVEAVRADVVGAMADVLGPAGILLRNDASVRRHEGLPLAVEVVHGTVPDEIEVREGRVRHLVRPYEAQTTGAFLDQRENHLLLGRLARGRALDVFTYQGLFALHMARRADTVQAVDSSAAALDAARANADLNACRTIDWVEANAFDHLRALEGAGDRFDTIVLDPPAFAKSRQSVVRALAGYKEINLRALRLLSGGGLLLTCSCSYHVDRGQFLTMLAAAAADSGRRTSLVTLVGQGADHPELLTVPETGYLKGALLRVDE
jgi:23S rRNA (cytosine1962-C5)-methyltransferase